MKTNMKRILYIAVSSQTGGVPKHILYALQEARHRGYKVTVAVPDDGDYYPRFRELASDVINLPLKPYSFRSLWKLRKYMKEHGIVLVHSHGKGAGMYARPLKILCPWIKVVHTFHGIYLEEYGKGIRTIYCGIEHVLKHFTDAFICVSESERQEAERLCFVKKSRNRVISNGVDLQSFQLNSGNKEYYLKEFQIPENAYILGCVARLEQMKGHRYLIDAFSKFVQKYPNCRLFLVGDGPEREQIKKQIEELGIAACVILTGVRQDVPQLLSIFDVFLSASLKEGMPFTLLEALAAGIPVVATDVIGNRDIIRSGWNGWLVPSMDSESLYQGICYVKEHPEAYAKWKKNGIETIKMNFTIERSMKSLFHIYDVLLRK